MKQKSKVITLCILLAILITVSLFLFSNDNKNIPSNQEQIVLTYQNNQYTYDRDLQFCLITGLDTYEQISSQSYTNNQLSDFLVLLVINNQEKTITPIHINRDSMVTYNVLGVKGDIVGSSFGQIALSHTYGDGELKSLVNVKDAVSDLFKGIHIDYYASITMDAIPIINDALGYVTVYMDEDYTSIHPEFIKGSNVTLKSEEALLFVRDRYNAVEKTNLARMQRQRVYMKALFDKFNSDDYNSKKLLESISEYVVSNGNITDLSVLINKIKTYELLDFISIEGEPKVNTNIEYYLDEDSLNHAITYCLQKIESK